MLDPKTAIKNTMIGQRMFNHELLLSLVNSGVISSKDALAISGKTAEFMRELPSVSAEEESFQATIASGFEQIAAAVGGLPPIR